MRSHRSTCINSSALALAFLLAMTLLMGLPATSDASEDPGQALMHHVTDGHSWRVLPYTPKIALNDIAAGPLTIPLTAHVAMMLLTAVLMIVLFVGAFRKRTPVPRGLASALEPLVLFVRDGLVFPSMGEELGRRWLPFMNTIFFFILFSNMLGLIPLFPTITANLSITAALAVMVFISVLTIGMRRHGFIGFFKNLIPSGIPAPIGFFLFFIELAGLLIRNGVLAIRLFANMLAGHFVIFSLLMLMVLVHPLTGVISVPLALFIDLLEVLVAIIQAMVFTMLSASFIGMAASHH
jgi:F-type H+-transporting ATPase subunit a